MVGRLAGIHRPNTARKLAIQGEHGAIELDDHDRARLLNPKLDAGENSNRRQLVDAILPALHAANDHALAGATRD
jgi:hypothetical protein